MKFEYPNTKICFYSRSGQLELYVSLAQLLEEKGITSVFITQHECETIYVKKQINNAVVYELEDYIRSKWDILSDAEIQNVMDKYENLNTWRMYYTDRFLVDYNTEDSIKMIHLHFCFFDHLFRTEKPNYYMNEAISIFAAFVAKVVGEKYGCKYIGTIIARDNARKQYYLYDDLYLRNKKMEQFYKEGIFAENELEDAKRYLLEFRKKAEMPEYMKKNGKQPRITYKLPLYPFKYLLERNKKKYKDKAAYMTYNNAFKIINGPLINYIQYRRSIKYYKKPIEGEKYYLFTLHYQPEASTLVCAQKYEKQLFVIDNIAKSIPSNTILYVKEHYAVLGHRDLNFYKELQHYPNVRLIDPFVDIHSLIKNCLATIVLTSTTGFEAILHRKKVFVLGEIFYDFFENAEKISDIYIEYEKLRNIEINAEDEAIIRFICAYKASLRDGCVAPMFDEFWDEKNIINIADGLLSHIDEDQSRNE